MLIMKKMLDKVKSYLLAEVEVYDQYLRGEVFGFTLEDIEGNEIDSCWGFFGSDFQENGLLDNIGLEHK